MTAFTDAELELIAAPVLAHESYGGKYDALNLNTDNAGVSVGILQWSQKGGGLAELLDFWLKHAPVEVGNVLGPRWLDVLEVSKGKTEKERLAPVEGALLWREPWVSRWKQAARNPILQRLQRELVKRGSHMRGAFAAADDLGVTSQRALTLMFDRAVQQGPGKARTAAKAAAVAGGSEQERLERFVKQIALGNKWESNILARSRTILDTVPAVPIGTRANA